MQLIKTNPVTPSQRNFIKLVHSNLSKKPLIKNKVKGAKTLSGRNSLGRITVRHRGGGHKKKKRSLNFNRDLNSSGIILNIEYDPGRNSLISAVYDYKNRKYYYILLPSNLYPGNIIKSGLNLEPRAGYCMPISKIPVGSIIHNISSKKNQRSKFTRAAGTYSRIIEKNNNSARIQLSSGQQKFISLNCLATLGSVSNENFFLTTIGKAGRSRWLNKRPEVRGVAMNPVDHPHGGGEGKTSGGKIQLTPWGKPTKNKPTKKKNRK